MIVKLKYNSVVYVGRLKDDEYALHAGTDQQKQSADDNYQSKELFLFSTIVDWFCLLAMSM